MSIIQTVQVYKNRSFFHTQKHDPARAKTQHGLSGMELCFPTSSWSFKTQDTGYHLTTKNAEVNQPGGLCGWKKKNSHRFHWQAVCSSLAAAHKRKGTQ